MVYRTCRGCNMHLHGDWYTNNQWSKGEGSSRCTDCVRDGMFYTPHFQCKECYREFNNQNELDMHMQVHRPREFKCPVCGDTRFRSPANAVQHIESGYCRGCLGKDNARRQIYEHVQRYTGGNSHPLLTDGGGKHSYGMGSMPDFPYQCELCYVKFRNLSQLMQHMDNKHKRMNMLGY